MAQTPLSKTTFLEAVAAAIEFEKKCFHYFLEKSETLKEGNIRKFFQELAQEGDHHIQTIKDIYKQAEGKELPNLKQLSNIHKFHQTTIQKLMEKLDTIRLEVESNDDLEALRKAQSIIKDAKNFYDKLVGKFHEPKVNLFFQNLRQFMDSNLHLIEAQALTVEQKLLGTKKFFWEDEVLLSDVQSNSQPTTKQSSSKTKLQPKSKSPAPKAKSKPVPKKIAKKVSPKKKKVSSPKPKLKTPKKAKPAPKKSSKKGKR